MAANIPKVLQELIDLIGQDAAVALAMEYGGRAVYVPVRLGVRGGAALVGIIPDEAIARLCEVYGGEKLHIPKVDALLRAARLEQMREQRASGMSISQLAKEHDLSGRRVRQILAAA